VIERPGQDELSADYRRLLDTTEDAVLAAGADFLITLWNAGAERMYGWAADEMLGRDARSLANTVLSDAQRAQLREALTADGRWHGALTAYRKDGTPIDVEVIAVAVRGQTGEITGYLGIHRDITERTRAERRARASQRALRASLQRTETILESVSDAFYSLDAELRFTYVNDEALRVLPRPRGRRYARDELVGQVIADVFPDPAHNRGRALLQQALRDQRNVDFEVSYPPDDRHYDVHVRPSADGLSVYFRDVTAGRKGDAQREEWARRQQLVAELGLRALASDELQPLLDEATSLIARTLDVGLVAIIQRLAGGDRVVLRAGVGWREGLIGRATAAPAPGSLFGYTLATGDPVVSEDVGADPRFTLSAALAEHEPVSAMSVVLAGREEPFGALGAFSRSARSFSPTDLHFLQAVANVLAAAVERNDADQRLIEVKEGERLRIARDLHDDALQQLSVAILQATVTAAGSGPDRATELVATLELVSSHLRGAVFDLRLGAEEDRPFPELLQRLVEAQRAMAPGHEIGLEIADDVPGDPQGRRGTEILRIAGEAIINARRHADAASILVTASGSARRMAITIADDGHGFDPAAGPPAGASGITGMRERAALLGGDLDITSGPSGTQVRLELALTPEGAADGRAIRVLLVEDHTAVREAFAAAIEREPDFVVVAQASSLAEARTMLGDVDVAVLDLALPDGDGTELIPGLRALNPRAQALVLTAHLDRRQTARAIRQGAAAALAKTARLDEFVDAVRRLRAGETLIPADEILELLRLAEVDEEEQRANRGAIEQLTAREREVLAALGRGENVHSIARRLHITPRTARNHIASILGKLGVHSQLQAVLFGLRYDLIELR
jgi:PAS domain S-box-containing protein